MKNPRYFTLKKLLLVFAGSLFLLACRTIQPVSVTEIEDVTLSSVSKKEIEMKFSLKIKNPNSFGFFIYKSSMYVKLDALSLGNAELKQKVFVKGNSEDTYTFEVKSSRPGTIGDIATITSIVLKSRALLELHGKIKAGRFPVKKKFPVDFKREVSLETP